MQGMLQELRLAAGAPPAGRSDGRLVLRDELSGSAKVHAVCAFVLWSCNHACICLAGLAPALPCCQLRRCLSNRAYLEQDSMPASSAAVLLLLACGLCAAAAAPQHSERPCCDRAASRDVRGAVPQVRRAHRQPLAAPAPAPASPPLICRHMLLPCADPAARLDRCSMEWKLSAGRARQVGACHSILIVGPSHLPLHARPSALLPCSIRSSPTGCTTHVRVPRKYREQEAAKEELAEGRWRCRQCGKRFLGEAFLDRHLAHRHPHLERTQVGASRAGESDLRKAGACMCFVCGM